MSWRVLARHGLLQTRVLEDRAGGVLHVGLVGSLVVLGASSAVAQLDGRLLLPTLRWRLAPPALDAVPDAAGLVLLASAVGLLVRRVLLRPPHLPASGQATALLVALALVGLSGFALEGLAMSQQSSNNHPAAFVGSWVAGWLGPDPGLLDGSAGGPRLNAWRWLFWCHAALGLALVTLLPFTRLRHAVTAPLNLLRRGSDRPDPLRATFRLADLVAAGSFDVRFGLAHADDLEPHRLELRACASCGRCEAACPVSGVGGELSPRLLVDELSGSLEADRSLPVGLSEAAIWSCLQCGACSEACPTGIQPHLLVTELRRGLLRTGRSAPGPGRVLAGLARSGNPYAQPRWHREELPDELDLPTLEEEPDADWLYWVGCAGTWDPRIRRVVLATTRLLRDAGLTVAILAEQECCTGDPARRSGDEARFQEIAASNLEVLEQHGVTRIVTHCPHCLHALRTEYAELGDVPEVVHHSELLGRLLRDGLLSPPRTAYEGLAFHDPCYLARFQGRTEAPRALLDRLAGTRVQLAWQGRRTRCCGGGGPAYWYDEERVAGVAEARLTQAREAGAAYLATGCPFCLKMLEEADDGDAAIPVLDLAELLQPPSGAPRP